MHKQGEVDGVPALGDDITEDEISKLNRIDKIFGDLRLLKENKQKMLESMKKNIGYQSPQERFMNKLAVTKEKNQQEEIQHTLERNPLSPIFRPSSATAKNQLHLYEIHSRA